MSLLSDLQMKENSKIVAAAMAIKSSADGFNAYEPVTAWFVVKWALQHDWHNDPELNAEVKIELNRLILNSVKSRLEIAIRDWMDFIIAKIYETS